MCFLALWDLRVKINDFTWLTREVMSDGYGLPILPRVGGDASQS